MRYINLRLTYLLTYRARRVDVTPLPICAENFTRCTGNRLPLWNWKWEFEVCSCVTERVIVSLSTP